MSLVTSESLWSSWLVWTGVTNCANKPVNKWTLDNNLTFVRPLLGHKKSKASTFKIQYFTFSKNTVKAPSAASLQSEATRTPFPHKFFHQYIKTVMCLMYEKPKKQQQRFYSWVKIETDECTPVKKVLKCLNSFTKVKPETQFTHFFTLWFIIFHSK